MEQGTPVQGPIAPPVMTHGIIAFSPASSAGVPVPPAGAPVPPAGAPVRPAVAHLFSQQAHLLYHTGFQPYFYMYI